MVELTLKKVARNFGGLQAVSDLNLSVEVGLIWSLIGPNGAGKTTVFNLITGVYPPSSGSIEYRDQRLNGLPPHRVVELGVARTFQNIRLFKSMTALENVAVGSHCRTLSGAVRALLKTKFEKREEMDIQGRAKDLLNLMGIAKYANDYAGSLPYGAQRRLEIARALASRPKMLLLDEPAAGMNPKETEDLMRLIRRLRDTGLTIFLVEHDMRLVMGISDRVTVLDNGRKIAEGAPKAIQGDERVIEAYLGRQYAKSLGVGPAEAGSGRV